MANTVGVTYPTVIPPTPQLELMDVVMAGWKDGWKDERIER